MLNNFVGQNVCRRQFPKLNVVRYSIKIIMTSQRAHEVRMTSYQCRCDVMTSHRRRSDVILTSCACWDGIKTMYTLNFSVACCLYRYLPHICSFISYPGGSTNNGGLFWSNDQASRQLAAQYLQPGVQINQPNWFDQSHVSFPHTNHTTTSEGGQLPFTVPPGFKLAQDSLTGGILLIPTGKLMNYKTMFHKIL